MQLRLAVIAALSHVQNSRMGLGVWQTTGRRRASKNLCEFGLVPVLVTVSTEAAASPASD
jgi:hypothetical protein